MDIKTNSKGHKVFTLPVSGEVVTMSPPRGRDMKLVDKMAKEQASATDIMFSLISSMVVSPQMSTEDLDDLYAEDVEAIAEVIKCFRMFNKSTEK